jgi:multidrug efflux system membrane fusion protein
MALALIVILIGCSHPEGEGARPVRPVVRYVQPVVRQVTDYEYFTGRTEATESVNIQARVTGYLDSIDFVAGADVMAGERLFKIDPRPYQAAVDEANGQVQLAEARLGLAIADYKRALEVGKTPGAISQQDIDKYAAAEAEARAAVAAAKANAESAKLNLEFTDVLSPINGVVSRNLLTVGNLVKQDTTLLTTVVSQDPIYAYFDVDERTLLRALRRFQEEKRPGLKDGAVLPVELGLADEGDEYPHPGRIDFINNQLDPSTGTIQVRGEFSNAAETPGGRRLLRPGLFVRIRLPMGSPYEALLVPQAALGTDQGRKYLLVVNDQDVVEYRPVAAGPQQADGLQVVIPLQVVRTENGLRVINPSDEVQGQLSASLQAGDRVVVGGLQRVRPGTVVDARPTQPMQAMATARR